MAGADTGAVEGSSRFMIPVLLQQMTNLRSGCNVPGQRALCGDLAERLARESIKNDTKGQAAKPSIAIDDSSEDEQERKPKRKKELAPFERKVEGLKKSMHERSVAISAAVKTHPSGSLPYASGAWFDSEFLRTLAFAKGVTCFLVVEGRLDVAVYTPTFQRDY